MSSAPSPQPLPDTAFSPSDLDFGDVPTKGLESDMDLGNIAMHAHCVLDSIEIEDGDEDSEVDSETGEALPLADSDVEDGIQTAEDELDQLWELDVAEACKSAPYPIMLS